MALAVSLTALAVAGSIAVFLVPDRRIALRKRVLVSTLTDKGLEGVLYKRTGPLLVLRDVTLIEPGNEPVKVDGEVVIESCQVEFVQVL